MCLRHRGIQQYGGHHIASYKELHQFIRNFSMAGQACARRLGSANFVHHWLQAGGAEPATPATEKMQQSAYEFVWVAVI